MSDHHVCIVQVNSQEGQHLVEITGIKIHDEYISCNTKCHVYVLIVFLCLILVCLPSGENSSCCSCEDGYAWPSAVCGDLITCPSVSLSPDLPCGYMKEMPFSGPYCEPQTKGKEKQCQTSF